MENEEMQEALETAHNFYVDREMGAVGKAAWWIEYVCRNKGAAVLQSIGEDFNKNFQKKVGNFHDLVRPSPPI